MHLGPGPLGGEVNADAFIWLDAKGDYVALHFVVTLMYKQRLRSSLKVNGNFREVARKSLAGPYKKGNAGPAPIINKELHCRKSLGLRTGSDPWLLPVASHRLAINLSGTVLSADCAFGNFLHTHRPDSAEDLDLLPAHRARIEGQRGLHCRETQQLKHVVGDHVAQCSGFFVKSGSLLDSQDFSGGDFHVIDVIPVPDWLKQEIPKSK